MAHCKVNVMMCCIISLVFQDAELEACLQCAVLYLRVNFRVMIQGATKVVSRPLLTRERPCQVTFMPSCMGPFYILISVFSDTLFLYFIA